MPTNSQVDAYINKAQPFAQPVLHHLRKLVHQACPTVEEKIKWGMPSFEYKGLMCGFASFKQHCVFGFWKAKLMKDPSLMLTAQSEVAMGHLGCITSLKDLPSDKKMLAYIKEAMKLNEDGIKLERPKPTVKKEVVVPKELLKAINQNKNAQSFWKSFPPGQIKEYVTWIEEAKTDATKEKRIEQAVEWIAEGKYRNWKYMKK